MSPNDLPAALLTAVEQALSGPLAGYRPLRVFPFGSRATGSADVRSDYDLAIDAGRPLAARDVVELREAFDRAPLLARVDVVDFACVDEEFRAHALRSTVTLHDRAA